MSPQRLMLQGARAQHFGLPLAQKLHSLKDERSVGLPDGPSPNTTLFSLQTHKPVIFLPMRLPPPLLTRLL